MAKRKFLLASFLFFSFYFSNYDDSFASGFRENEKTIYHYDGRSDATDAPVYITFNPAYRTKDGKQSPQYRFYGGNKKFWEEFHWNEFHWYSIVPRKNPKADDMNMKNMLENNQTELGCDGNYLVSSSDCNLKKGRQDPRTRQFMGNNSGTTLITVGPHKGKYYEWRYLGYTPDGEPVDNPFFPDDYTVRNTRWYERNWQTLDQVSGYIERTQYDFNVERKIKWIKEKLLPANPELIHPRRTLQQNAEFYAKVFSVRSNPDISTGIVTGWHKRPDGSLRYVSFVMKKPVKPNLRLVEFNVYLKKDTNGDGVDDLTLIAWSKRNPNNDNDIKETRKMLYGKVSRGQTYVFTAKVKNMKTGANRNTKHQPITLDHMYAFDEQALKFNEYSVVYEGADGARPTSPKSVINYGETVEFKWEYTVPLHVQRKFLVAADIPIGFFEKGDNIFRGDDKTEFIFNVEQEDIGLVNRVELIDMVTRQVTTDVVPGRTYTLRYFVKKFKGNVPVGNPNNPSRNPFASIDVLVSDLVSTERGLADQRATRTLRRSGDVVAIEVPNAITARGPCIFTRFVLNEKHRRNGQSTDFSNDGPIERRICSDINISVKNLLVKPQTVKLPYGTNSSRESLSFSFDVTNYNKEGQTKDIPFVIYKQGTVLHRGTVVVPANKTITHSVHVSNVPLSVGNETFYVEVNYPNPTRRWVEYLSSGADPYADNIAKNGILVERNETPVAECRLTHTRNDWTTRYYLYEWNGTREYYWVPGWWEYDDKGNKIRWHDGYWSSYCKTNWTRSWTEDVSHYETYRVKHIWFKSKVTKDEGQEWVDVLNGGIAKVRAGYGFELKIVVEYVTTTRS